MAEFPPKRFFMLKLSYEWPIYCYAQEHMAIDKYKELVKKSANVTVVRMDYDSGFWKPTEVFFKAIHKEGFVENPEGTLEYR